MFFSAEEHIDDLMLKHKCFSSNVIGSVLKFEIGKSHVQQAMLKTWIDSNRVDP